MDHGKMLPTKTKWEVVTTGWISLPFFLLLRCYVNYYALKEYYQARNMIVYG
jgi:hypothetical protein